MSRSSLKDVIDRFVILDSYVAPGKPIALHPSIPRGTWAVTGTLTVSRSTAIEVFSRFAGMTLTRATVGKSTVALLIAGDPADPGYGTSHKYHLARHEGIDIYNEAMIASLMCNCLDVYMESLEFERDDDPVLVSMP